MPWEVATSQPAEAPRLTGCQVTAPPNPTQAVGVERRDVVGARGAPDAAEPEGSSRAMPRTGPKTVANDTAAGSWPTAHGPPV